MALDPIAKTLVRTLAVFFPDLGGKVTDAAQARAILAQSPKPPVAVELPSVADRLIPGPEGAPDIRVRVYRPVADPFHVTPGVVFFHGGGFVICDLDTHDDYCRRLASEVGATVVSVEYRLAPETPFPGAVEDAYAATAWVADNAAELGIDPARLAIAGDSAGGNLSTVTCLAARDRRRAGLPAPDLVAQVMVYPSTDMLNDTPSRQENAKGYFMTLTHMLWFRAQYVQDPALYGDLRASPLLNPDLSDLPPALVVTAEHDPLRDEGESYARRLAEAGVPAEAVRFDGMFHGFMVLPHPEAARVRQVAFDFLREAFARQAVG
jgi:acetyl esterase